MRAKIHLYIICLLLVVAYSTAGRAQTLQASRSHFSTDDGLSSNAIAFMTNDDYGFLWIATWNGLSRFDGYNFYNYRTGNGSHIANLHNRIFDMVIDPWQNVWMRMYDGRIFVVDRRRDRIINPLESVHGHDEFRTESPMTVTSSGDVLVTFDGVGIYKLRLDPNNSANNEPQLIAVSSLKVTDMAEGYHNDIWVGTDKGVHRLDLNNLTLERKSVFPDEYVTMLYSNGYNIYIGTRSGKILTFSYGQSPKEITDAHQEITGLYVDNYGVVWYSDLENGVCRYRPATGDTKRFQQVVPAPEYDSRGSYFREAFGHLWVRMNHGGYGYYNRETDEIEYFHNDPTNPWNLSNTVNANLELEEGVIWESTNRRGLEKLEVQNNSIERTLLMPESSAPTDNEVRAMCYDTKRRQLLIGNKNNALFVIRGDGSRSVISHDSNGNPIGRPYGVSIDSKGNYWMCSKDYGVFLIKPQPDGSFNIQNFRHSDNDKWSLSSNAAYQAVEDRHGNIWVATFGGGVNVLVPDKKGGYRAYHSGNVIRRYPYNAFKKIRTIELDKDGNVWAGSSDGILIMSMQGNTISVKQLQNSELSPDDILMSTDIVCLARARDGSMWVGTNGGGISHTKGKDKQGVWLFESYGTTDGLPSEEIRSICVDKNNNVWFSTDMNLCSFDVDKKIFSTFGSLEGVSGVLIAEGSAVALPNGNVLFGTLSGYYTVDRKKLSTGNGSMLKLRFTDFFLNDELQSPRLNNTFKDYIPETRRVVLPGHNMVIAVRFASLNYQLQHRVHYQYKLEGYEDDWKNADKSRTVSYASLPTGTYHLRVKAFLIESPDSYDERVLEIVVPPYFLLSKNAAWIYMFLIGVLAILLMFWRQRQLLHRENMRQLKLQKEQAFMNDEDRQFVEQLREWLENHYSNSTLKTDEMVALSNMSRTSFHNKLNTITGMTPETFLADFRLKKAAVMLETTQRSIVEVAQMTGFGNALNMTRAFKQRMGLTPEQYRKQSVGFATSDDNTAASKPQASAPLPAVKNVNTDTDNEATDDYEIIE